MPTPPRYLTVRDVCARLNLSDQTIHKWLAEGRLKGLKVGRAWRIREEDLEALLAGNSPQKR